MSGWKMLAIGLSDDRRTMKWRIFPSCGHKPFTPRTTMLNVQHVECPRCGLQAVAHYNEQEIVPEPAP